MGCINKLDLCVPQGATWAYLLTIYEDDGDTLRDISADTFRMQVRSGVSSSKVLLELTTGDGLTVIDGPGGVLRLSIDPEQTTALFISDDALYAVYDLELVSGATVYKVCAGGFTVVREVTR